MTEKKLTIPSLKLKTIKFTVQGDSSLITNKWSEKAKQEMKDKHAKKAKNAKPVRDDAACQKEFEAATYYKENGDFGFPAIGFKAAAVTACTSVGGMTKVAARQAFHVIGDELVSIKGKRNMREDMVRLAGPGNPADIRYRPEFKNWKAEITVQFNENVISAEQIIHMFNTAGFAVGVGEWRPEKDGVNGMFHVEGDVKEL